MNIPDNYEILKRYEQEKDAWLERRPVCCGCGEPIQEERAVNVDGDWYCPDCELDAWAAVKWAYMEDVIV